LLALATLPALIAPVGAQQLSDRAKQIGGKFMCMCSCSQVLTQCNHVGCSTSTAMLKEINQSLTNGGTEETITQAFLQEFGTKVYAEPPKTGFSLVAWALPTIYLVIGTALVIFVISRWRKRNALEPASTTSAGSHIASDLAPHRTKLDQLLERRDTIYDNLRDLRFEYRSGKYSEGDFEAMKVALEQEAALVLAEIDQVTESQVRRPRGVHPADRSAQ
jgi:cytochrome c-type biogenesis protein CcmH